MRNWPPLSGSDEAGRYSENFASLNRNKRSIAVDLKDPQQIEQLKRLVTKTDVVVENFRAGVLQRLGLGYAALQELNPALVYCSISGYGRQALMRRKVHSMSRFRAWRAS